MNEMSAEMVKLTHKLTLLTLGGHVEKKPIITICEIVLIKPTYQVSMPYYKN